MLFLNFSPKGLGRLVVKLWNFSEGGADIIPSEGMLGKCFLYMPEKNWTERGGNTEQVTQGHSMVQIPKINVPFLLQNETEGT